MEEQTRQIGEVTFYVAPLTFSKGRRAMLRLGKKVAPGLGAVMEAVSGAGGNLGDVETTAVGPALQTLLEPLTDEDLEYFAETFGSVTRYSVDGEKRPALSKANREILFRGQIVLFFQWLAFAIEVNYADFFGLLKIQDDGPKE